MMTPSLVLTGLMGAGKSTVGQLLAQQLGFSFVDLDHEIERTAKQSISEIFATAGEHTFRDLETQALKTLQGAQKVVVASGGGAVLRPENRALMRNIGLIVWLDIEPEVAYQRICHSDRPLLQVAQPLEHLRALAAKRHAAYADCDLRVNANADAATVAKTILALLAKMAAQRQISGQSTG